MARTKKMITEDQVEENDDEVVLEPDDVENKNGDVEEVEDELEEDTPAADTIKAHSSADAPGPNRLQTVAGIMGSLATVDTSTLQYFDKMIAQSIANSKGAGIGDGAEGTNQGSIKMHPSAAVGATKEEIAREVEQMLGEDKTLSKEFKEKAAIMFEAALEARVNVEVVALEDAYEERLNEELAELSEGLEEKVQTYIEYVAQEWMNENEVAIESSLRNEIAGEFMLKLRDLFNESNISIPEDQIDVVDELATKVDELESRLAETIEENADLREFREEAEKTAVIEEAAQGLTLADSEKFKALAEAVEADDIEEYVHKVVVIKESLTGKKPAKKSTVGELLEEVDEANLPVEDENAHVSPVMKKYLAALTTAQGAA